MTSIAIPETVNYIDDYAFSYCDGLTSVVIPKSVISIEDLAFSGSNLSKIVILGDEVRIVNGSFGDVSEVTVYANEGSTTAKNAKEVGYNVLPLSEADLSNDDIHQHVFGEEWTIDKEATCKETGSKSHHCTGENCTEKTDITEIPKLAHTEVKDAAVEKTCTTDGLTEGKHCSVCNEVIQKQEVVKATGHTWDAGKITRDATTTTEGEKTYTCTACGETKTEVVPIIPDAGETTQQPTTEQPKPEEPTTEKPDTTKKLPKVGTKKTISGAQYKVTKSTSKLKEVTFVKPSSSKKTSFSVPSTVKISGYTYKVTAISDKAFKNNKKLKSVTIGKNVKKIGEKAFYNCKKLNKITIKSTVLSSVGKNAIKNIDKKATIKVPKKQLSKYKKLFKSKTGYKKTMKIKK